jgi:dienelactone hydrolase
MLAAVLTLLLIPQAEAPQPGTEALAAALARAVDLPTAAERRKAVAGLLKLSRDVATWRAVCESFGDFVAREPGPTRQSIDLQVLDAVERTELFLYVPRGYDPAKPAPLLLWGHGAGGSGEGQHRLWQQVADEVGMLVLAPTEFGSNPGYGFTPRERAAHLAALRWARRTFNVDENAIFVGGWSRGGHLTWDLMLRYPDLFAGALPVVGGPRLQIGEPNNLRYLENAAHLPIRDLQGAQDDPLLLANLELAFARLKKAGAADAQLRLFPDRGHDADLDAVDWVAFFAARRTPKPERVVRLAADPAEVRAAWVEIAAFDRKVAVEVAPQVDARQWERLDDAARRALLCDKLLQHTARLAVADQGRGRFVAEGTGVRSFALWLEAEQLGADGSIEVRSQSRTVKKKAIPDAAVLLGDFVERFDRTRLPVARVAVP